MPVVSTKEDMSSGLLAEEIQQIQTERFKQITQPESLREVFWIFDFHEKRVIYASPSYEHIWGRPCTDLYKNPIAWTDPIHEDDRQRVIDSFFANAPKGMFYEEYQIVRPDGGKRWIRDRGFPIKNEIGGTYRVGGIAEDITDIKEAQESFLKLSKKLEEKNKDLENFAYMASHDLQEPLRTVSSYLRLFVDKYNGQLDSQGHKYADFMLDATKRMKKLIADLLNYSTLGSTSLLLEEVSVREILEDAKDVMRLKIEECGAEILYDQKPKSDKILCDREQMGQVFMNLISNSIKFRKKEIKLGIRIKCRDCKDGCVSFTINDSGMGIAEVDMKKIFLPFKRGSNSNGVSGTGLGLAICKRIVENHGGRIWARTRSLPTGGTSISFCIPRIKNLDASLAAKS